VRLARGKNIRPYLKKILKRKKWAGDHGSSGRAPGVELQYCQKQASKNKTEQIFSLKLHI
jgi:hypothetical protein